MIGRWSRASKIGSTASWPGEGRRRRRRSWGPDVLEGRVLLTPPTIYTVNLTTDTGEETFGGLTLREAVNLADTNGNPGGTLIQFDPTVFGTPQTIVLGSPLELSPSKGGGPVEIEGPGSNFLTISGNRAVDVFQVEFGLSATISDLTIEQGAGTTGCGITNQGTLAVNDVNVFGSIILTGNDDGAGINNEMLGNMTVTDCTIENNIGGGILNSGEMNITGSTIASNLITMGAAIDNRGTLQVSDSTIESNWASGISSNGTLTVTACTIADNTSDGGGGGAGIDNSGDATVSDSTISGNNAADGPGGGIFSSNEVSITNSTIANNTAASDGGGVASIGVGQFPISDIAIVNSTIAYNTTVNGSGGGLYVLPTAENVATLANTIVALNAGDGGATADDIGGGVTVSPASGYNLIGTGGSGGLTNGTDGNQVGIDNPGLSTLGSYGGPTQTIELVTGSPALAAGSVALAVDPTTGQTLTTDQRGLPFARIVNGVVDIGAYQSQDVLHPFAPHFVVGWGTSGLAPLQFIPGGLELLPTGRKNDLPWMDIHTLQVTLDQPAVLTAADVMLESSRGIDYGPVTVTGSGMNYTITFAHPIEKADRVTIAIDIPGAEAFSGILNVLPGDVNDYGRVNAKDLTAIRDDRHGKGNTQSLIFGDILGDGDVNGADYASVKKLIGTRLPRLGGKHPEATLARALVRRHLGTKRH